MGICFEIPTNSPKEYEYLRDVASNSKTVKFAIVLNGPLFSKADETREQFIISRYHRPRITEPAISMTELRSACARLSEEFGSDYRIIGDGDFFFKSGWEEFIIVACYDMERFSDLSGRGCYLSMAGVFGSAYHQSSTFLSPKAIMGISNGIIYHRKDNWDNHAKHLAGGYEDPYINSIQFKALGSVPLKKMMSPIIHKRAKFKEGSVRGPIHDLSISGPRNAELIRELWGDPFWRYAEIFGDRSKDKETGIYFDVQPKAAYRLVNELRNKLMENNKVREYFAKKGES